MIDRGRAKVEEASGAPTRAASATSGATDRAQTVHDLRTPLTVVVGRVQLLRRHLRRSDTDRASADLEAIEAALTRLSADIDRVERKDRVETEEA